MTTLEKIYNIAETTVINIVGVNCNNWRKCKCEDCVLVNYPETKDFGASWAGQSNLQPYLHTLEFPPFQRYLIC